MNSLVCRHLLDALDNDPTLGITYICRECYISAIVGNDYVQIGPGNGCEADYLGPGIGWRQNSISIEGWWITDRDPDEGCDYIQYRYLRAQERTTMYTDVYGIQHRYGPASRLDTTAQRRPDQFPPPTKNGQAMVERGLTFPEYTGPDRSSRSLRNARYAGSTARATGCAGTTSGPSTQRL